MADAFQCDECGEFVEGRPHEKVLHRVYYDDGASDIEYRAELCEACSDAFAGGLPDPDDREGVDSFS